MQHPLTDTSGRAPSVLLAVLVLGSLLHLALMLAKPLEGPFRLMFLGHNAARYALAGRNYARHGFTRHLGAPDLRPGAPVVDREGAARDFLYLHHPPLVPWIVGASFAVVGESEKAAQIPFYVIGLAVPLAVFLLARRCLTGAGAAFAACFAALVPMSGFYGGHVDPQGGIVQLSLILQTLFYLRFRASRCGSELRWLTIAALAGMLADWSAAYAIGAIVLVDRTRLGTGERRIPRLLLAPVAFGVLYVAWLAALGGGVLEEQLRGTAARSPAALFTGSLAAFGAAVKGSLLAFVRLYSWPLLALAALALFPGVTRRTARGDDFAAAAIVLFACAVVHVVLFPQGFFIHDYWTYLFLMPLALAAGATAESLRSLAATRQGEGFGVAIALALALAVGIPSRRATLETYAKAEVEGVNVPGAKLGKAFRELVRPDQRALTNLPYFNLQQTYLLVKPEFAYYADRVVRGGIRTAEDLTRAVAEEGPFDRFVHVSAAAGDKDPVWTELIRIGRLDRSFTVDHIRYAVFDLN